MNNRLPWLLTVSLAGLLAACGSGGGSSSSAPQPPTTTPPPEPTLTFTASAASIDAGDSVTLDWQSTDSDGCTASGGWTGSRAASGSETITDLQSNQSYTLSCAGAGGGIMRDVDVTVVPVAGDLSLAFSADRTLVGEADTVRLSWTTDNATNCDASGDWSGGQGLSGTFDTPPLGEASTFVLTCSGNGDTRVEMVNVEVVDLTLDWQAPVENTDDTPLTDLAGFRIYHGTQSGNYDDFVPQDAAARTWQIDLPTGNYFIAITALDANGEESANSNEVQRIVP